MINIIIIPTGIKLNISIQESLQWQGIEIGAPGSKFISKIKIEYRESIGTINWRRISESGCAMFASLEGNPQNISDQQLLQAIARVCTSFTHGLWLIRDNGATLDEGYLFGDNHVYAKGLQGYSSAQIIQDPIEYDKNEIATAFRVSEKMLPLLPFANKDGTFLGKSEGVSRMNVFFTHFDAYRSHSDLALRILHGVSALESIVSTSKGELAHSVSERVALLISDNPDIRLGYYDEIKQIYNIRSSAVHGSFVGKTEILRQMLHSSLAMDGILRNLITHWFNGHVYFESIILKDSDIDKYFKRKILGSG